jgi:hypothetical protein
MGLNRNEKTALSKHVQSGEQYKCLQIISEQEE